MLHKRFLLINLIIISTLITTACGMIGSPKTVKVAASLPLGLEIGTEMLDAAQLALTKAAGKAGNVNVELVSYNMSDPQGSPASVDLELTNATAVVDDPSIVAYLGPISSDGSKVSIPILNQASITQISSTATWPGLTKPGYSPGEPGIYYPAGEQTFFRTVPSDEVQAAAAARWCVQLGFKKVYIVNGMDPYGVGLAGVFELTARDEGLEILGNETFDVRSKLSAEETLAIATRALDTHPDLIYVGGGVGSNSPEIVRDLRQLNPTIAIMGPDAFAVDEVITFLGKEAANNIYGTTISLPPAQLGTAAAEAFVKDYEVAYGREPSTYDAATYEAMSVLLYAIEKAERPTREEILKTMQNLGDYSGVFGTWHFDEQGDISVTGISGLQVQNGTWVFVEALK